jgi:hypothetical protein
MFDVNCKYFWAKIEELHAGYLKVPSSSFYPCILRNIHVCLYFLSKKYAYSVISRYQLHTRSIAIDDDNDGLFIRLQEKAPFYERSKFSAIYIPLSGDGSSACCQHSSYICLSGSVSTHALCNGRFVMQIKKEFIFHVSLLVHPLHVVMR